MCLLWILFWEELFPILFLSLSVNFSHMGLVPIWLKFIKSFRKRVWGRTLFQKGFPQQIPYSSVGLFGKVKINSVYSPLTLRTIIFPPWSLMIERTILRPSPTPVLSSPLDLSVL